MTALKWVIVTAIGFVLFLCAAVVFSLYSSQLSVMSASTYFFLLVGIALIAAGFLFGALRSHAVYKGQVYHGTLELSGPVVVMALIIFLGYQFRPSESSFAITINVFSSDSSHSPVNKGELTVYYGTAKMTRHFTDGQVMIAELPNDFRGKEVTVVVNAEGYAAMTIRAVIPVNNQPLNIFIDRQQETVNASGIVVTANGKAVAGAVVVFADGVSKATTDEFGNFRIQLPLKDGTETTVRVYRRGKMEYNNLVRLSDQMPITLQLR